MPGANKKETRVDNLGRWSSTLVPLTNNSRPTMLLTRLLRQQSVYITWARSLTSRAFCSTSSGIGTPVGEALLYHS